MVFSFVSWISDVFGSANDRLSATGKQIFNEVQVLCLTDIHCLWSCSLKTKYFLPSGQQKNLKILHEIKCFCVGLIEVWGWANNLFCLYLQWIIPTVNNSLKPLTDMEIPLVIERLLKLAVSKQKSQEIGCGCKFFEERCMYIIFLCFVNVLQFWFHSSYTCTCINLHLTGLWVQCHWRERNAGAFDGT